MDTEINPIHFDELFKKNGEYVPEYDLTSPYDISAKEIRENEGRQIRSWWDGIKSELHVERAEVKAAFESLKRTLEEYMPEEDIQEVEDAYLYAFFCHQYRSIEPDGMFRRNKVDHYMTHPIAVASILSDLKLRKITIISALLHDVREDTYATAEEIYGLFGMRVGQNVEDATKIRRINRQESDDLQLYKLNACVKDVDDGGNPEAVLLKIADKLHNMRTLSYLDRERQEDIALDAYQMYAPLADRLGLHDFAEELRYLAFKHTRKPAGRALKLKTKWNGAISSHPFVGYMMSVVASTDNRSQVYIRPASIADFIDAESTTGSKTKHPNTAMVVVAYETEEQRVSLFRLLQRSFVKSVQKPIQVSEGVWDFEGIQFGDLTWNVRLLSEKNFALERLSLDARYRYDEQNPERVRKLLNEKLQDTRAIIKRYEAGDKESFRVALTERYPFDQIIVVTPKGDRIRMNKGSTAADFAYEIHKDLLPRAAGIRFGEDKTIRLLSSPLSPGNKVEIVADESWKYLSAKLLTDGFTSPSALSSHRRNILLVLERGKSDDNFYLAMEQSKLRPDELDALENSLQTELRAIALQKLEEIYAERFTKKPEYDFSEAWEFLPKSFRSKFENWDEFLYALVLKEIQPRFMRQLLNACTAYEGTHIDTGLIQVTNRNGVIADFSSTFEESNIGIIQVSRPVNDVLTPKGAATIRFLLDPKSRKREEVEEIVRTLQQKNAPDVR